MTRNIYFIGVFANYIIGAGMFALPYIALKVGIWTMLGYFLFLGPFVVLLHLFYGELSIRTPGYKQLPGFAKFYFGDFGEKIAFILTVFSMFGSLLVYLILGGEFLQVQLSPVLGGESKFLFLNFSNPEISNLIYTFLLFCLSSVFIFFGRKTVFRGEFFGFILFMLILFIILYRGFPLFRPENLLIKTGNISDAFLPFGPVLFSLWGLEIIPVIKETLGEKKSSLKKIIIFGSIVPILVYLFFILVVLGVSGMQTTESSLPGLKNFLGNVVIPLTFILGIVTNFTSFNSSGLVLKEMFQYDFRINKNLAWAITCFFPLLFFLIGVKSFIAVISLVGGTVFAITGILVLLMYQKVSKNKFIFPFILILMVGVFYEIIYFLK